MANKFVVTQIKKTGEYRFKLSASVELHLELVDDRESCLGGGWFYLDKEKKILLLYKKSQDYGRPSRPDLIKALENSFHSPSLEGFKIIHSTLDDFAYALSSIEDGLDHTKVIGTISDMSFIESK